MVVTAPIIANHGQGTSVKNFVKETTTRPHNIPHKTEISWTPRGNKANKNTPNRIPAVNPAIVNTPVTTLSDHC